MWWCTPLIPGRGRQISEFKVSLVYKVSSRTARAIQRNPVSKKTKTNKTKQTLPQQLKALTALAKDPGLVPRTHMTAYNSQ